MIDIRIFISHNMHEGHDTHFRSIYNYINYLIIIAFICSLLDICSSAILLYKIASYTKPINIEYALIKILIRPKLKTAIY